MKEGQKQGAANILITNGCINYKAAEEVLALTDATNIDLKSFSQETYSKLLGGNLAAVLNFIRTACETGVHVEISTLVVPGLNDKEEELDACIDFIASLTKNEETVSGKSLVPWHLSAYHPDWKWKAPPTSPEFLKQTAEKARKRLAFVYTGNIAGETNDSSCPYCGKILVSRRAYTSKTSGLVSSKKNGKPVYLCASCSTEVPIKA